MSVNFDADGAYVLGVDGGGTKTIALLADTSGQVVGRGSAGSSNWTALGEAQAQTAIEAAIAAAYADAGAPREQLPRAACLGLAGVDRREDEVRMQAWADRVLPGRPVKFVNDVELVLAAGTPDGWGVGVISGTGAIAIGKTAEGRTTRVSGWGWVLGDEGSGFAIGQAALQAVVRAADGRSTQTALTAAILKHWSLAAPEALLPVVYQTPFPRSEIAALAAVVDAAAGAGDQAAIGILRRAGRELALAAVTVAGKLGYGYVTDHHRFDFGKPLPGALAGGVLVNSQRVRLAFEAGLQETSLRLEPMQLVTEPVLGAIKIARRLAEV